ncbi:MAG: hypothetical protein ACRD0G_15580 [Acidimicrobiales bacterium]
MSELEALVAVYGAIDRAVVEDAGRTSAVAPLLGPYIEGKATGWFEPFDTWIVSTRRDRPNEPLFPDVEEALRELAETPPDGRMRARRLLAIGALARALPERFADDGPDRDVLVSTLRVDGLARSDEHAGELLRMLVELESLEQWPDFVARAFEQELIPSDTAAVAMEAPCSGDYVVLPGRPRPVTVLKTSFCLTGVSFQDATTFLDPANWPHCSSLWCSMTPLADGPQGQKRYLETLSTNCGGPGWTATVCLQFWKRTLADGSAVLEYAMCEEPGKSDELVEVDEGSIIVRQDGANVCVRTTKRLRFAEDFDGPFLAMIACALGYGAVAEDLILSCAQLGKPGSGPAWAPSRKPASTSRAAGAAAAPDSAPDVAPIVDNAVEAAKKSLDDCVVAFKSSHDKVRSGTYTADDLTADLTTMWKRAWTDLGTMLDLANQTAGLAAKPTPPAPAPPERA